MKTRNNELYNIFLVDDDPDEQELFKESLKRVYSKAIVTVLNSGEDLLMYLMRTEIHLPDLVFLDINMPGKNGIECLREIRKVNGRDELPVIMYSNSNALHDIQASYTSGANIYITKPSMFEEEVRLIKKILGFYKNTLFDFTTSTRQH